MYFKIYHHFKNRSLSWIFSINPSVLGDVNKLAWTNLGYWDGQYSDYRLAAETLAMKMGDRLQLKNADQLLDIGCGHGASLELWHQHYGLDHIDALELQQQCCDKIKAENLAYVQQVLHRSIFDSFYQPHQKQYDVIVSLDATYHYAVQDYLFAIELYLKSQARIGFHTLVLAQNEDELNKQQQRQLKNILKLAKVDLNHILKVEDLKALLDIQQYHHIEIEEMTVQVLDGFSRYIEQKEFRFQGIASLDHLKIRATAKLCAYLVNQGLIQYVQVTAQKKLK